MYYNLLNYFDVYGSKEDGWIVNNVCVQEEDLYVSNDSTDKEILEFLVRIGFLSTSDMRRVRIEDDGENIYINQVKDNVPLGALIPRRYIY